MNEIPRRGSVDDPDHNWELGAKLEILLNGTPRDHVISFDCDHRTLTRYKTDVRGELIVDLENERVVTETLHGDVAVRFKDEQADA